MNNNCIFCDDKEEGGIEGCKKCYNNKGRILCFQCKEGFYLLENNLTCIKISENKEIEQFINCQRVSFNNNKLYCSKCLNNYNLLRENDELKCVNNNYIITPKPEYLNYCKEYINNGTDDNPKHSCIKCIENDILPKEKREKGITFTKITYFKNYTSYCDISGNYLMLDNCSEAMRIVKNDNIIYNCTKCTKDAKIKYEIDSDLNICEYTQKDISIRIPIHCNKYYYSRIK